MEQHILVGLYIGSGAASAAVMLSDKKDRAPTQITWPFRRKSTIPLRVLYEDRDAEASFRWGDQVEEANADTLFGICAFTDPFYSDDEDLAGYRRLVDQLHGKRGKQYYHLPWSVYADLSSISDAQLMLFIRAVKQHVLDSLTQIYSEAAMRMKRLICIVVPPHISERQARRLRRRMMESFQDISETIRFITQPHAAFLSLEWHQQSRLRIGDYLIACHIEETLTTISVLRSVDHPSSMHFRLSFIRGVALDVGSSDVLDGFQGYVENNCQKNIAAVFRKDKMSASEVLADLLKMRNTFADQFSNVSAEKPELIRIASLGLRLRMSVEHMQEYVFDPVIKGIASQLRVQIEALPHRDAAIYILLSGALGESPYVHDYLEESVGSSAVFLDSIDEALTTSLGSVMHLTPGAAVCETHSANWTVEYRHIKILDVIQDLIKEQEEEIYMESKEATEPADQRCITRRLEMILKKRIMSRGINDHTTKSTCLSLVHLLHRYDRSDEALALIQRFAREYTKDRRAALGPGDARNQLENLHLAAALQDKIAIQILVAGETAFPINAGSPTSAGIHKAHTPLELHAWYCQKEDDSVEILLESGADESLPAATRIAARRGRLDLLQTFESWRPDYFKRDAARLLYLALAGGHLETSFRLSELEDANWSPLPLSQVEDPLTREPVSHDAINTTLGALTIPSYIKKALANGGLIGDVGLLMKETGTSEELPGFFDAVETQESTGLGPASDSLSEENQTLKAVQMQAHAPAGAIESVAEPHGIDLPDDSVKATGSGPISPEPRSANDGLVEALDASALRELLERDKRRRERKRNAEEERLRRKLERRAEKQRALETSASPASPGEDVDVINIQSIEKAVPILMRSNTVPSKKSPFNTISLDKSRHEPATTQAGQPAQPSVSLDPNTRDVEGRTELSLAASRGALRTVTALLAAHYGHIDINAQDYQGRTPLAWATINNHASIVDELLANGANANIADNDGRTPISWAAARNNDLPLSSLILETDTDSQDNDGRTPLSWAAASNSASAVEKLLAAPNRNFNVNKRDKSGRTPLHWAAASGIPASIWLLLKHGANPFLHNDQGENALACAADREKQCILWCAMRVKWLSPAASSRVLPDWVRAQVDGKFLREAVLAGNALVTEVALGILESAVDFGTEGDTVLHVAAWHGHDAVVKALLENKHAVPDINDMDRGRTPLHLAVEGGHGAVVMELLKHGADVALTTPDCEYDRRAGRTALELAIEKGQGEVAVILRDFSEGRSSSAPAFKGSRARRWIKQRLSSGGSSK